MNGDEGVLSKVPELKHTLNKNPEYIVTHSYHRGIMLSKAEDIKAPGWPRKVKRFTSLKKDFSKASSVRYMLCTVSESTPKNIKKAKKEERKIDNVEEENEGLIEETSNGSRAFLKSDYVYAAKFLFEKKKKEE